MPRSQALALFSPWLLAAVAVAHDLPWQIDGAPDLAAAETRHAADPADPDTTSALVNLLLAENSHDASPAHLARALAALAPWRHQPRGEIPAQILLARARLHGRLHRFAGCFADLQQILTQQPNNPDVLLARATTRISVALYPVARDDIARLAPITTPLVHGTARAWLDSVTGGAPDALARLEKHLLRPPASTRPAILHWAHTTAADIAVRLGRLPDAHRHFRAALALAPGDPHTLAAYSDLLLATGDNHKVLSLISADTTHPALLLRHTLAGPTPLAIDTLDQRFRTGAHSTPPLPHHRDRSRFFLELKNDPAAALDAAIANWSFHREPEDALVLLQAAAAAGRPAAALPAIKFAHQHNLEDVRITPLVEHLSPAPPQFTTISRNGITVAYPPGWHDAASQALALLEARLDATGSPDPITFLISPEGLGSAARHIASQLAATAAEPTVRSTLETALHALDAATRNPGPHHVQLWDQAALRTFLNDGGQVPGYSFDRQRNTFTLSAHVTASDSRRPATTTAFAVPIFAPSTPPDQRTTHLTDKLADLVGSHRRSRTVHAGMALHEAVEATIATSIKPTGTATRWFAEGAANAIAASALAQLIDQHAADTFLAAYNPSRFDTVVDQVDLENWQPGSGPADPHLRNAHYALATARVLKLQKQSPDPTVFFQTVFAKLHTDPDLDAALSE